MEQEYSCVPIFTLKLVRGRSIRYPSATVSNHLQAAHVMDLYLRDKDCEHLIVIMIDAQNQMIGLHMVAVGGISGLNLQLRDIFKAAIAARASSIILGHNHPSGATQPSQEDISFTKKAVQAGKLLGIGVVDHIIVSSGINQSCTSFMALGMMEQIANEAA